MPPPARGKPFSVHTLAGSTTDPAVGGMVVTPSMVEAECPWSATPAATGDSSSCSSSCIPEAGAENCGCLDRNSCSSSCTSRRAYCASALWSSACCYVTASPLCATPPTNSQRFYVKCVELSRECVAPWRGIPDDCRRPVDDWRRADEGSAALAPALGAAVFPGSSASCLSAWTRLYPWLALPSYSSLEAVALRL